MGFVRLFGQDFVIESRLQPSRRISLTQALDFNQNFGMANGSRPGSRGEKQVQAATMELEEKNKGFRRASSESRSKLAS